MDQVTLCKLFCAVANDLLAFANASSLVVVAYALLVWLMACADVYH